MCHLFHILQKTNNKHKQPVVHESTYLVNTNRKIVKIMRTPLLLDWDNAKMTSEWTSNLHKTREKRQV